MLIFHQQSQATGADKQHLADLESLICATLQSLVRKVNREDALQIAPTVMEALLLMFQSSTSGSSSGVLEDAIMTVGVLVEGEDDSLMVIACMYMWRPDVERESHYVVVVCLCIGGSFFGSHMH